MKIRKRKSATRKYDPLFGTADPDLLDAADKLNDEEAALVGEFFDLMMKGLDPLPVYQMISEITDGSYEALNQCVVSFMRALHKGKTEAQALEVMRDDAAALAKGAVPCS